MVSHNEERLDELQLRILACAKCPLHLSRNRAVPGEGNRNAETVFVGQGPGGNEDRLGRPFVGRAGDLLDEFLGEVEINRSDVWLTNVTRCLPPDGRLPFSAEIKACAPYLLEEIDLIKPKVVCPLGNIALKLFLGSSAKIQEVRGKSIPQRSYFLFPLLHTAAVLRRPDMLPSAKVDFTTLKVFLDSNPELEPPPGQESLF